MLRNAFASVAAGAVFLGAHAALAVSGTWNGTVSTLWTNSANWSASPYAGNLTGETATFSGAGNGNTNLNLAGVYSLANIVFDTASVAPYTIGTGAPNSQTLVIGGTGEYRLTASAANSQTFNCGIQLGGGIYAGSYSFRNDRADQVLTFNNVFAPPNTGVDVAGDKTLTISGAGNTRILGNLSRGGATTLTVTDTCSGTLTLSGSNVITTLNINGGANTVVDIGSGYLFLTNGGGTTLTSSQGGTINGTGTIQLSINPSIADYSDNSVAAGKTLTINPTITGAGGFEVWGNTGTFVLNGTNTFSGDVKLNSAGAISVSRVGNKGSADSNLGKGSIIYFNASGAKLIYTGSGETTDRSLYIWSNATLDMSGPSESVLTFTAPATVSSGAKTLTLQGSSAGVGEFGGVLTNGAGALSVIKEGTGTWRLTANNTYTGTTTVGNGTLALTGADGALSQTASYVLNSGALLLENAVSTNNTNRLNDAAAIALSGASLVFSHSGGTADYRETAGTVTVTQGASEIAASQAAEFHTSTLTLDGLSRVGGTVNFCGSGLGESDRNRIFIGGQADGLIGPWATLNGTNFAAYSSALGVYAASATSFGDIAARGYSVITNDPALWVRISTPGNAGPISLQTAPVSSAGVLVQNSDTPAEVITTGTLFQTSAILIAEGKESLKIGTAPGEGALSALTDGGELLLSNKSTNETLTVNADLADNASASSLSKSGAGSVVLMGATAHTGPTTIAEGTLTFGGQAITQRVAGAIGGSGALVKSGTNLLHLAGANTYTGATTITGGIVRVNEDSALGSAAAGTVIAQGATLDVGCTPDVGGTRVADALSIRTEVITVRGSGSNGQGAIINSSTGSQLNALGRVTLAGDATFGGLSRWDVRNGWFNMSDHVVTKTGPSIFSLSATAVTNGGGAAAFDVQEGALRLQSTTALNGSALNTVHLRSGTRLSFYDLATSPAWSLVCDDSTTYEVDNSASDVHNRWAGPVTLNGAVSLTSDGDFRGGFTGQVSGSGSLFKTNDHSFFITGTNNTYTGPTRAIGGWLYVTSLRNVGEACSLGQPTTAESGTIKLGGGATPGRILYTGTGDTTDRVIDLAGTTGWATLSQQGLGHLTYNRMSFSGAGSKNLYLLGDTAGTGEIADTITNGSSGLITVIKQGSGSWTLSGNNTYGGDTLATGAGSLTLTGNNVLPGNTALQDNGSLTYTGTNLLKGTTTVINGSLTYAGANTLSGFTATKANVLVTGSVDQPSGTFYLLGATPASNAVLRIAAGASMTGTNDFSVRNSGALYLDGGTFSRLPPSNDGERFCFGYSAGGYGYFKMTAGALTSTRLYVGSAGTGIARLTGGSSTINWYTHVGRNIGGVGVLTVDGSAVLSQPTANSDLFLGFDGGYSEINLLGGSLLKSDSQFTLGNGSNSPTGMINLCAGILSAKLFAKNSPNGSLWLNFCGGTLKAGTADSSAFIPASLNGVYTYGPFGAFSGGAYIDTTGRAVTVAAPIRAPTGLGVFAIAVTNQGSGLIGEPYVSIRGGGGSGATAVANMTDDGTGKGTYKVASVTITCPGSGYSSEPVVTFLKGGNGGVAAAGNAILSDNTSGGLTKLGAGTLTLATANTYGGKTAVSNGTLRLAAAGALPAGTDLDVAGGTLDIGGYSLTNGAFTASQGLIMNGSLTVNSFTKTSAGTLTLATPLASASPILIESGTVTLPAFQPGLYEGFFSNNLAMDTTSGNPGTAVQLTTRMANTGAAGWSTNTTYIYSGFIWNRAATNVTWTFAENFDDSVLLVIDGTTLLNNSAWAVPTTTNYTLTPGRHAFDARFFQGTGGAGPVNSSWWTTSAFGFGIDYLGRNATNIANYVALTDPGDGRLLTTAVGSGSNLLASASSIELGTAAVLDLGGLHQDLADLSGNGIVSNGTVNLTGALTPGGANALGTLTLPCVSASGTLRVDIATTGETCDRLNVQGDIALSGLALEVANPDKLDRHVVYTLLACTGTRTGTFSSVSLTDSRWRVIYRSDGSVQLLFAGGTLIRLK